MNSELQKVLDRHDDLKLGWFCAELYDNCGELPIQDIFLKYRDSGRCSSRDPYSANFIAVKELPYIIFDGFSLCWNCSIGYFDPKLNNSNALFISSYSFRAFLNRIDAKCTKTDIAFFKQALSLVEKQLGVSS